VWWSWWSLKIDEEEGLWWLCITVG
jgi:hypothetical protein